MGINKLNYTDAKKLIYDIDVLEDTLTKIDRDRNAKKSKIVINIQVCEEKNGWPSTYNIPTNKNYHIYNCLKELFQDLANEKYQELNNLK